MGYVTYPSLLGIGAAFVGIHQWGTSHMLKVRAAEIKAAVKGEVAGVRGEVAAVKVEVAEMKAELKGEVAAVKVEMAEMKAELTVMKRDIAAVLSKLDARLPPQ
jgi:ribosomal protein S28E/S33